MAHLISGLSIGEVWRSLIGDLLFNGNEVSPRGMKTKEILNTTLTISEGLSNILENGVRNINYKFMIAEWLWIQAGLNDVETLARYNSVMKQFSDDGFILSGAYGPRLMPQMSYIVNSLNNKDTRQAVATIWTPNPKDSKDIPCTISLQWLIRDEKLHCTVNMRSSDAWLGIPYDFFTFSQLTNLVAATVKLDVGSITMNLASSHLYEVNWETALESQRISSWSHKSPPLENLTDIPTSLQLKSMLDGKIIDVKWPWYKYFEILLRPRSKALEVLRDMSLKQD